MKKYAIAVLAASLSACAAPQQERIGNIATTLLRDLNLTAPTIPSVLLEARLTPYFAPADQSCDALLAQVRLLDDALGPDIDVPVTVSDSGDLERATAAVGTAAVGALQKTVEGAIPFRGWMRKLSGAERHASDVAAAILAGTIRRGFLKGIALARACGGAVQDLLPLAR